jgi:pimeloyl-ACP methyl ester carboxylesterase
MFNCISRYSFIVLYTAFATLFSASNTPLFAAEPKRPLVFVPGILGSKLCNGGTVLWGDVKSLFNFAKLEIQQVPSSTVGIATCGPASGGATNCGLVERINLLGPFWAIHEYDGLIKTLEKLGYRQGSSLFVFCYDWRLSNYDTAKALQAFVARTPQLNNRKIDILAHSMGGYATSIFLRQLNGKATVEKVIYLGTPFTGSMNALATLSGGWGAAANMLVGGIDAIRKTVLSLPAFYELFPRYKECCRIGSPTAPQSVDIFNFDTWQKYNWLPAEYATGNGANTVRVNLNRSNGLRTVFQTPVPEVKEILIAGDAFATNYYLYAAKDDPRWQNWTFSPARGDGTVPVWSAANTNSSSLAGSLPSFSEHATIFDDKNVENILLRELISNAPPLVASSDALFQLTTTVGVKSYRLIDVKVEPNTVSPNTTTNLLVTIDFNEDVKPGDFIPTAQLVGQSGPVRLTVVETTTPEQQAARRLTFSAGVSAPPVEGAWRVDVLFPGQSRHSAYFTTWVQP